MGARLSRVWWHGVRSARSKEGYSVRLRSLTHGLEYREGDRVLRIGVERAAVNVDWIIYLDFITGWLAPHQHEPISEEKRQQVRKRVIESLDFLKIKYYLAE